MDNLNLNIHNYTISTLFLLLLLGGLIGIIFFLFLTRYRNAPGVKYLMVWQLASSVWAFTYAFEFAANDLNTKIFWSKLSYIGIVYCSVSFFFFALEYSSQYHFLKKKFVVALYALSTLFILSPVTNGIHHLHWKNYFIISETHATGYVYGPFFWVIFAYSYIFLVIGIVIIAMMFFRLSAYYKRQIVLLFIASLIPPLGNVIYVFHINPIPGFDWTPFSFLLTGALISANIFLNQMFDLVPFARAKLFDILPDAILIINNAQQIADCNPALKKLTGDPDYEVIGRKIDDVFPHRKELIHEIVSRDEYHTRIFREVNGITHYFDLHSLALFDQHQLVNGRLIVLQNITRHVEAEEKIRKTNTSLTLEIEEKEKLIADLDAFSHTVAHDLKNMLGAIVSATDIVKTGIDDLTKEELLEINDLINSAATKTQHITKELLTLASVRQEEIKLVPVDMKRIVRESVKRLNSVIQESRAKITIQEEWPEALGYGAWLEEVWINYLSNAIKYGGIPPVIQLGSDILNGDKVKFWIKDNGNGLSAEDISVLFNQFTRLDSLRAEGNGLGLSIVKRIVEKLGGEVGVDSKNIPGEGSTFYFVLNRTEKTQSIE
jgi:PAS domain S-box-containing protein